VLPGSTSTYFKASVLAKVTKCSSGNHSAVFLICKSVSWFCETSCVRIRAGLNEREAPGKVLTARPLNA